MKKLQIIIIIFICAVSTSLAQTASFQSDFTKGKTGTLPDGWKLTAFQKELVPDFSVKEDANGRYLSLSGGGDAKANAHISTNVRLTPGTYMFKTLFSISGDVNPQRNLLFQINSAGIHDFYRLDNGMVEGRETIVITGNQARDAVLRVYYRFNAGGEVKIRSISITPTEPVQPRWARFACTQDTVKSIRQIEALAEQAAKDGADLLLYPEGLEPTGKDSMDGDGVMNLLSKLAAKHKMYLSASIYVVDKTDGKKYNRGVLYDRSGKLCGVYDKIHPYSPETNLQGITPGSKTDIFETDFGKIGMVICADVWFTDVTQLFALKGAEVILYPVAGYFRSLIPARCADNRVGFVISVIDKRFGYGIFDTAGRDVQAPDKDPTVFTSSAKSFKDVRTFDVNGVGLLVASLDMNCKISPHYWGGTMVDAPGGKRNRDDQIIYLDDMIKKEKERWWKE